MRRSPSGWAACLIALIAGACRAPADRATPESAASRPDSAVITISGPTLVPFFVRAYTVADSGGETAESLGDLLYHLGSIRPQLDSAGVRIEERYGQTIEYALDGATHRFVPNADSGRAGILALMPGRPPRIHYGILTEIELADSANSWLGVHVRHRTTTR